ncbi:MAG: hypothetical protein ACJ754_25850 [Pyrinomonadaceae bacterium]
MRDGTEHVGKSFKPVVTAFGARRRSEGATLLCAVTVAVALGVAFGIWVNARLTPRSSAEASRPARLLPDARASEPAAPPAPAAQPSSPCDGCETASLGEATPARGPADKLAEAHTGTDSGAPKGEAREAAPDADTTPRRTDEVAAVSDEPPRLKGSEAVAAASPDPSRPVAWEVTSLPKAGRRAAARVNVEHGAAQSGERAGGGAQARPGPCALYASTSSLSLHVGGAAPLVLGGPGEGVRINVNTPDWSQIAVIYEGPAAGQNGWLRYSVKSVGRRPGLYTVHFSTPCGSQTISVTVTH